MAANTGSIKSICKTVSARAKKSIAQYFERIDELDGHLSGYIQPSAFDEEISDLQLTGEAREAAEEQWYDTIAEALHDKLASRQAPAGSLGGPRIATMPEDVFDRSSLELARAAAILHLVTESQEGDSSPSAEALHVVKELIASVRGALTDQAGVHDRHEIQAPATH